jgi:hypothetical protein
MLPVLWRLALDIGVFFGAGRFLLLAGVLGTEEAVLPFPLPPPAVRFRAPICSWMARAVGW